MPLGPMSLMVVLLFLALNSNRSSPFIFCVCACIFALLNLRPLSRLYQRSRQGSPSITADISTFDQRTPKHRARGVPAKRDRFSDSGSFLGPERAAMRLYGK